MDWLVDALLDSLKILPILFASYVLIEFVETMMSKKAKLHTLYSPKIGPLVGASFGIIPECGFGIVATDLYSKGKITVGTLIAIFIATSDEALPLLISNLTSTKIAYMIIALIATKFILGIVYGYIADLFTKHIIKTKPIDSLDNFEHHDDTQENHEHNHSFGTECKTCDETFEKSIHKGCCGHEIEEDHIHPAKQYVLHPLLHTLKMFIFVVLINVAFGALINYVGEESLQEFLTSSKYFAPIIACLIGLIPNCAASFVLTDLMIVGGLSFSACIAGLIVNAGISYIILFKQNKNIKNNLFILLTMLIAGISTGYIMMLFGI